MPNTRRNAKDAQPTDETVTTEATNTTTTDAVTTESAPTPQATINVPTKQTDDENPGDGFVNPTDSDDGETVANLAEGTVASNQPEVWDVDQGQVRPLQDSDGDTGQNDNDNDGQPAGDGQPTGTTGAEDGGAGGTA